MQIRGDVCATMGQKEEACVVVLPYWMARWTGALIVHPIWAYGVLAVIALAYLGRRYLSFAPIAATFGGVEPWSQALEASVSRWVARRHPEIGDRVGAIVAAAAALAGWFAFVAILVKVLHLV